MIDFKSFLNEAAAGEDPTAHVGGVQHAEHPSDRIFDGKAAAQHALGTVRNVANGTAPISRKIDDRMSYITTRDEKGRVGVKYKGPGSHFDFTPEDIDTQHGAKPYKAAPLKLLLKHLGKVLPKRPGTWQGGYMSSPADRTVSNGRISHTPNTIEYSVPADTEEGKKLQNSEVSTVIHSELTGPDQRATPVTDLSEFGQHPDVHLVNHLVSHDEQSNMDPVLKRQANAHLDQAEKMMQSHSYDHHHGHEQTMRQYINSTVDSGEKPSSEGYKGYLQRWHQKKIDSVKTQKSKDQKQAELNASLAHVDRNKDSFEKSFKIHGHIQQATNLLARALARSAHGGYGHAFKGTDGQMTETGPEGFMSNGLKIVDRGEGGFSAANRARSAILRASKTLGKKV